MKKIIICLLFILIATTAMAIDSRQLLTMFYPQSASSVLLSWSASSPTTSTTGPAPAFSYSGNQYDDDGASVGANPSVHHFSDDSIKGLWAGPAYANGLASGVSDITSWTQRGTTVASNGDGSYRVTLGGAGAKDIFSNISTLGNPHLLSIMVKRVSGANLIKINDSNGVPWSPDEVFSIDASWKTITYLQSGTGEGIFLFSGEPGVDTEVDLKFPMSVGANLQFPPVLSAVSVVSAAGSSLGNGMSFEITPSISSALSGICTMKADITAGVSSAGLSSDTSILSARDSAADVLYFSSGGSIKSSDGTNTATVSVSGGWVVGDAISAAVETDSAGTQFRVVYKKNDDADYTPGDWQTYDGSFNPGTHLRPGHDVLYPMWIKSIGVLSEGNCSTCSSSRLVDTLGNYIADTDGNYIRIPQ